MDVIDQFTGVIGARFVLTGADAAPYGKDWMGSYVAQPVAVLKPADTAEVSAILKIAHASGTPIVPVGGNTGLVGGTYAPGAVMLSLERLNEVRCVKPTSQLAVVGAGAILDNINGAAEEHDLAFPLFFGARGSAMIGGALSTNAGGSNVVRHGNARALCLGLEVVLADGQIMDLMGELRKDNTGYDLKDLFIGAEGTLGVITAAVVKLVPRPLAYATAMVAVKSLPVALELLNRLQVVSGGMVEGFEFMPDTYMARLKLVRPDLVPPLGYGRDVTLLVELGATAPRDALSQADGSVAVVGLLEETLMEMVEAGLVTDAVVAQSSAERQKMWAIREVAAEITIGRTPYVDTDIAVPLDRVAEFYETVLRRVAEIDGDADTNTVAHLGDGNLHFTVWPSRDDPAMFEKLRNMIDDLAVDLGGSFSAEHGVGLSKKAALSRGKDPVALAVMQSIKGVLDPRGIMNPGKVLP